MISPKTIQINAYRATGTENHSIFRGGPVKFVFDLDNTIDLTGCTSLRLDIRGSVTDTNDPLATEVITTLPAGQATYEFEFSSGQTNHDTSSAWLVLSALYPEEGGSEDDNLDPLYIATLTIVLHNASNAAPPPPNAAVLVTSAFTTIAVDGEDDVEADGVSDTLTLVGDGITITTDASTDTITFTGVESSFHPFLLIGV